MTISKASAEIQIPFRLVIDLDSDLLSKNVLSIHETLIAIAGAAKAALDPVIKPRGITVVVSAAQPRRCIAWLSQRVAA